MKRHDFFSVRNFTSLPRYNATFKELQDLMRLDGSTSSISIVLLDRAVRTSDFDAHFVIFWMHYETQAMFTAIPPSPAIRIGSLDR